MFRSRFFEELIENLSEASSDNWDVCEDIFDYYCFRIFILEWTFFRILRTVVGWCLGILPLYFLFLVFLLILYLFLKLFFALVITFFDVILVEGYKEDPKASARVKALYDFVVRVFRFVLVEFFEKFLPSLSIKIDYFFTIDCWQNFALWLVAKIGDFFAEGFYVLDKDIERLYYKSISTYKFYERRRFYYIYVIKFFYKKFKYKRNWVILYFDLRKVYVIFKNYFFKMSFYDWFYKTKLYFVRSKAICLVFMHEHFYFFFFLFLFFFIVIFFFFCKSFFLWFFTFYLRKWFLMFYFYWLS